MSLNPNQFRILIAASVIFVAMGLFPPWIYTVNSELFHREKPAGYASIFSPPPPETGSRLNGVRLDISRLLIQWIVLVAATGGVLLLEKVLIQNDVHNRVHPDDEEPAPGVSRPGGPHDA